MSYEQNADNAKNHTLHQITNETPSLNSQENRFSEENKLNEVNTTQQPRKESFNLENLAKENHSKTWDEKAQNSEDDMYNFYNKNNNFNFLEKYSKKTHHKFLI